jgi:hypothetical protein
VAVDGGTVAGLRGTWAKEEQKFHFEDGAVAVSSGPGVGHFVNHGRNGGAGHRVADSSDNATISGIAGNATVTADSGEEGEYDGNNDDDDDDDDDDDSVEIVDIDEVLDVMAVKGINLSNLQDPGGAQKNERSKLYVQAESLGRSKKAVEMNEEPNEELEKAPAFEPAQDEVTKSERGFALRARGRQMAAASIVARHIETGNADAPKRLAGRQMGAGGMVRASQRQAAEALARAREEKMVRDLKRARGRGGAGKEVVRRRDVEELVLTRVRQVNADDMARARQVRVEHEALEQMEVARARLLELEETRQHQRGYGRGRREWERDAM